MPDELTYQNRLMNVDPINCTMAEIVDKIERGLPQVVELEPGDATHYALMLVPLTSLDRGGLERFGIQEHDYGKYLFVSYIKDTGSVGVFAPFGPKMGVYPFDVVELSTNEWSRDLIAWWLTQLYKHL